MLHFEPLSPCDLALLSLKQVFLPPKFRPPRPLYHDLYGPRPQTTHAYFLSQCCVSPCPASARTQPKLEPTGLLPHNPQQRPADILINGLPDIHISSWRRLPRLALDCAITYPFQHHAQQVAGSSPLVSGIRYGDLKRKHLDTKQHCEQQQIGFEPLIMESSGGIIGETATLLSSLCGIIDRHEGLSLGCTWQECQIRLAIDLHRGLHGACSKQLTKEPHDGVLQGASAAFHTTYI